MTAEERRERKISDIYAKSPNWKPSRFIQARMRDAYEAGRSAGLEEAAKVADDHAIPRTILGISCGTRCEWSCYAQIAAAIRSLITAPQKGI